MSISAEFRKIEFMVMYIPYSKHSNNFNDYKIFIVETYFKTFRPYFKVEKQV